mgnify:CR=1 FL=1
MDVAAQQSIVINGDLGSGKTTVSVMLAQRLGLRRISVGDIYRRMAEERGMTALQLNLHAELDDEVDGYVDRLQRQIAESGEQLVVDSRLAWFFFTDALKVHLVVDPTVGASRVLGRPDKAETYSSLEEAKQRLRERSESERVRFLTRYGADKTRLRNYNLVCDSTRAEPEEIVEHVIAAFEGRLAPEVVRGDPPLILADPARIYPTQEIGVLRDLGGPSDSAAEETSPPLRLGHADGHLFVVDGHRRLSRALRSGRRLVAASLAAEGDEIVVGGMSARSYFEAEVGRSMIYDWCAAHGTDLPLPPHLTRAGAGTVAE